MSLKKNISANYVSQLYTALLSIIIVPFYVKIMGVEAFGLVGFFSMLQAWFLLLDAGLTPTMSRETARFQGGVSDIHTLRQLLRSLELIFVFISCTAVLVFVFGSGFIASKWLKVQSLNIDDVKNVIILISIVIACRWISGLYRGVVTGFEKIVWLSHFNIIFASFRFIGVLGVLAFINKSPMAFFIYQVSVAFVELLFLSGKAYRLLPGVENKGREKWDFTPLKGVLRFSLNLAFVSVVWIFVTQTDKLILSKILTLSDYSYFTLAVLVANGIMLISSPVSVPLLPRMTNLYANKDEEGLIKIYREATQLICVVVLPVMFILAFFSEKVLLVWSGNLQIAEKSAPIMIFYALGNGILSFSAFPYYLQFAKGKLKLHVIGNIVFVVLLIPAIIFATIHYGPKGAGCVWLLMNLTYLMFWTPVVHKYFAPKLHVTWLCRDIMPIVLGTFCASALLDSVKWWPLNRAYMAVQLFVMYGLIMLAAIICSAKMRHVLFAKLKSFCNTDR